MRGTSMFRALAAMISLGMAGGNAHPLPAPVKTSTRRDPGPYVDKTGLPHGYNGSKLARKAARGTVGLRHGRGPHAGMHLIKR